jgi:hypothetical protein
VLFFKPRASGWQIGRVDQGECRSGRIQILDQRVQQMTVDLPQTAHPDFFTEGVHHAHVGQLGQVAQPGKTPPSFLFGEQAHEQIEGMHRSDEGQQMQPPQLRGTEVMTSATGLEPWPPFIQVIVRHEG